MKSFGTTCHLALLLKYLTGTLYMQLQDLATRCGVPGVHGSVVQGMVTSLSQHLALYQLYINNLPGNIGTQSTR